MRVSPFWRSGLTFTILLLAVLPAVDFYTAREFRRQALGAVFDELEALARVAEARPPQPNDPAALANWISALAASGARVTLFAGDGRILAASPRLPGKSGESVAETDEFPSGVPPEVRQAMAAGEGREVRHSQTLDQNLAYLAIRQPVTRQRSAGNDASVVLLALPLTQIDQAVAAFRLRLWSAYLILLVFVGTASLVVSRNVSGRIRQLKEFAGRVAAGDFQPLDMVVGGDEIDDLARALNSTTAQLDGTIRVLTDERNRSAAILRSMIEGVAVISAQGRVLFSNRAFSQILGLDTITVEGRPLVEVVRQSDLLAIIKRALANREEISNEIVVGTVRPRSFAVTASPVKADGPAGAVLVLHEISELRRLERVRQDFVANISHEFRTPLTAIQGFAETLLGGALDDTANRRRFVEIIRNHAARLARLTEDLLKLSRIEAGQLQLEFRSMSVEQLVDSCFDTARLKAAHRGLSLDVRMPSELPQVRGDASRLLEVLQNLLDNAVQYTPAGGHIEVSAARVSDQVVVTVSDTGIGIPQAEQGRIFERFYRVDAARSREAGGTGLGLSIARHIVDAHGGRLWVDSAVGEGARFHFSLPTIP